MCNRIGTVKMRSRTRLVVEAIEGITLLGATLALWPVARRWFRNWGSTAAERARAWPGDELVDPAMLIHTRAITIAAPAQRVWTWVAQFGLDRAGFYSYELFERLVGIPVTNVESIESEWQELSIRDEVRLHPKAGIRVSRVERNRFVCFGEQTSHGKTVTDPTLARSWSIYVDPVTEHSSRLVIRSRMGPPHSKLASIATAAEQPIDFLMEQRMLRTIKRLAETQASR